MTSLLALLLFIKIIVTLLAVILPFTLKSSAVLASDVGLSGQGRLLQNLYVMAMLALVVNYSFGLQQLASGVFPVAVICVGIVSNIGAALTLAYERFLSATKAPLASLLSIAVFGGIGIGFVVTIVFPDAMTKLLIET